MQSSLLITVLNGECSPKFPSFSMSPGQSKPKMPGTGLNLAIQPIYLGQHTAVAQWNCGS